MGAVSISDRWDNKNEMENLIRLTYDEIKGLRDDVKGLFRELGEAQAIQGTHSDQIATLISDVNTLKERSNRQIGAGTLLMLLGGVIAWLIDHVPQFWSR